MITILFNFLFYHHVGQENCPSKNLDQKREYEEVISVFWSEELIFLDKCFFVSVHLLSIHVNLDQYFRE